MQGVKQIEHDGYAHKEFVNSNIQTSWFDLSHSRLMTFDMGELVPMLNIKCLPGDYFEISSDILVRTLPLVAPLFHHITVNTRYYFCPHRIIWNESGASFLDYVTGGVDGTDASVWPYISNPTYQEGTLADYLGYPIEVALGNVDATPFRVYSAIWNEYYRNEDTQTALTISLNDAADSTTNTTLKNVNWLDSSDYFVSAMERQQRGTAVSLPLGTSATVILSGTNATGILRHAANGTVSNTNEALYTGTGGAPTTGYLTNGATAETLFYDPNGTLTADLSTATASTINQLREASAMQLLQEMLEMAGSRYRNYLQAVFGVNDYQDARLHIPEILGGKTSSLVISEVLQTSKTDGTALGTMAGHAIAPHNVDKIIFKAKEHGTLMATIHLLPEAVYQEGIPKNLIPPTDRWDIPTPQLAASIGNQPILNKELYAAHSSPTGTFAYQRAFASYMMMSSSVHGDFRSESDTTLETWHLARDFGSDPSYDDTFMTCTPDKARIFASSTTDCILAQIVHYIKARRPLPAETTPYKLN